MNINNDYFFNPRLKNNGPNNGAYRAASSIEGSSTCERKISQK